MSRSPRVAVALVTPVLVCFNALAQSRQPTTLSTTNPSAAIGLKSFLDEATVVTLPTGKAATQGFTAKVTFPSRRLPGYVPILVELRSSTAFTSDRRLTLRITPINEGHSPPVNCFVIDIPLRIEQGTKVSTTTHYVPRWTVGNAYQLQLMENNQTLREYETQIGTLNARFAGIPSHELLTESDPQWVYIRGSDTDRPDDIREIVSAAAGLPVMAIPEPKTETWFWDLLATSELVRGVPVARMPTDWRGYQSVDTVIAALGQWRRLRDGQRQRFDTVREWMLCGGTIVVSDSVDETQICELFDVAPTRDEEIEVRLRYFSENASRELLRMRETMQEAFDFVTANSFVAGTTGPGGARYPTRPIPGFQTTGTSDISAELLRVTPSRKKLLQRISGDLRRFDRAVQRSDDEWRNRCALMRVAAGQVIGLRWKPERGPADPSDESENVNGGDASRLMQWHFVRDSIMLRKSAMLRRGIDPVLGDARARRWLIPGVAEPPVYTFMGLLGVFVILVGPVAYRQTSRQGRSHLMFAIAPALAICTTLAMFGYGIVADGFGTHARVRQLTWVDGASGDAGERIRATYFAGIRPGDGLRFPPEAEVFHYPDPVGLSWEAIQSQTAGGSARVSVSETQQRFNSSFLPSRQQKQFVFHRPRQDVGSVTLWTDTNQAGVSSTFDIDLRDIVLCDSDRQYWTIDSLPGGADDVKCAPLTSREASQALSELYFRYRPLSRVVDGNRNARRTNRNRSETYDLLNGTLRKVGISGASNMLYGIFETQLQQWLQTDQALPPECFVALADVSTEAVSVDGSEMIESVRYVFGTLKP